MTTVDPFALWQAPPETEANAVSFSASAPSADTDMAVFRLDLPGSPSLAGARLAQAETQVQASERALTAIPQRLERLHKPARPSSGRGGDIAFSTTLTNEAPAIREALPQPEAAMLDLLNRLKSSPATDSEVSFGLMDQFGDWNEAQAQFMAALKRVQRLITTFAWIETQVEGNLLAQTVVSWTGDVRTAWEAGVLVEQQALHRRAMRLALASRQTMLRTVIYTTQTAFQLTGLLAVPGGQIMALPVAWKYVNQILSEIKLHRAIAAP